jgi:hypothetical protein
MMWDRNEWQGRSKEQVKRNYTVFKYSIIIGIIGLMVAMIKLILN